VVDLRPSEEGEKLVWSVKVDGRDGERRGLETGDLARAVAFVRGLAA
jgi:hypothetical protein